MNAALAILSDVAWIAKDTTICHPTRNMNILTNCPPRSIYLFLFICSVIRLEKMCFRYQGTCFSRLQTRENKLPRLIDFSLVAPADQRTCKSIKLKKHNLETTTFWYKPNN